MKTKKLFTTLALLTSSLLAIESHAVNILNESNSKAVGNVRWHLQSDTKPEDLIKKPIPKDNVSIFFVRPLDNDPEQTSANIAINDRYQVSLQPGSFTQVYSCVGVNRLSTEVTGQKTNDLLANSIDFNLAPNNHYFFYVDVDSKGNSTIQPIESDKALNYLEGKRYQAHQITRVVPNCPIIKPSASVITSPVPAPVLEKEVSIELEVLFDNDKAIVKQEYFNEVQELAEFMQKYSNTSAIIEGHTDSNASDDYNQKLSERRANAIKQILISKFNISPDRLSAIGYGEQRPRATNKTAEGRQLNRRTIAVIKERVRVDQEGNQILK